MDEDVFPVLCPKKTYSKPSKKVTQPISESINVEKTFRPSVKPYDPGVPLTTKAAVEYLLSGKLKTSVCRYCLKVTIGLSELDQIMHIGGTGAIYKVSIREMIACFYPFKARQEEDFPEKICQRCLDRAINAYLFTQQCEQAERALHNCFDDMNEKFNKLDPVVRPKKRGRQKLNPNYNVLHTEHYKVLDYAEPIRNIINLQSESLSNEPYWNDFECKKCWEVFPNLESLLNHEQVHPKYMWYHCRLCGKSFVKQNQLKKHFNHVHVKQKNDNTEVEKTFKCQECGNITENYVQHLQHIEKHKFKCIMKHLIERKTDQLCLVCLKKSTDLVELDKMVSIHGSCPELVGDKTLYTVLASTLPDHKSYKYQELYVPYEANIMTITQRKRKLKDTGNLSDIIPKIGFKLSLPKIVTKEKFKTDDFYYYVFCDPQPDKHISNTIDYNIATPNTKSPRIFEITDEETMDCNLDDQLMINDKEVMIFGKSSFGDILRGIDKQPAVVNENCNTQIEMLIDTNEAIDSNVNNEIQVKDRSQIDLLDSNENNLNLVKYGHPVDEMVKIDDEQPRALTGNYNVKGNILKPMDVVNEVRKTDNPVNSILIDDKYPTDFVQSNLMVKIDKANGTNTIFNFSNPIALEFTDNTTKHNAILDVDKVYIFNFSNPYTGDTINDQETHTTKLVEDSDAPKYDMEPIRTKSNLSWIFTKTSVKYNLFKHTEPFGNITNDCKFCWFFKHLDKCEYCKKPIDEGIKISDEDNQNIQKETAIDNITKNTIVKQTDSASFIQESVKTRQVKIDKYPKELKTKESWQCNICLTNNNPDRSTCHCCESKKYIENGNCKVTLGKNKTFFMTTDKSITATDKKGNLEEVIEKGVCISNDTTPVIVIDEPFIIETENGMMQENIEEQMENIRDTNSIYSMDIETDSVNYNLNTEVTVNDNMDVEEDSFIPNTVQKFDPTPTLAANVMPTPALATNVLPFVGTNIQFNIGSNPIEKEARKIKRAFRRMPKAFHK